MNTLARATMAVTRSMSRNLALSSNEGFKVTDESNKNRFIMNIGNEKYATIDYEKSDNVYDLIYTKVPEQYKGKGYGLILAEKTLDYIAKRDLRMKLTCDFLLKYYKKNEDKYKKFVV